MELDKLYTHYIKYTKVIHCNSNAYVRQKKGLIMINKLTSKNIALIAIIVLFLFVVGCSGSNNWANPQALSNLAPVVVITAPLTSSTFDDGSIITLIGSANDSEDGVLPGTSLVWTSDRDGQIGTGLTINSTTLSRNTHVVTLTATDRSGAMGTATVTLTVRAPWFDPQWGHRQMITISSAMTQAGLVNFPALIKITDQANPLFDNAQPNGDDILFTEVDGVTQLDHEIEYYMDTATKELDAWVKVATLSSVTDTILFMYYGNGIALNQENVNAVWSNDFQMVQHLEENPGDGFAGHVDSSPVYPPEKTVPYNFMPQNFTDGGGGTTDAMGKIGGADLFAGDNDFLAGSGFNSVFFVDLWRPNFTDAADPNASWTFSAWIKTPTGGRAIYSEGRYAVVSLLYIQLFPAGEFHSRGHNSSWASTHSVTSLTAGLNDDAWHYVVMASDNGDLDMYIDGVHDQNYIYTPIGNIHINFSTIGAARRYWSGSYKIHSYWEGSIDEVRVSRAKRSADWINASFLNQNDPGTGNAGDPDVYTTFGTEELF